MRSATPGTNTSGSLRELFRRSDMRTDVAILYGTMTGNALECAERTATALRKAGFAAQVHDLARYDLRDLLEESTVLLAISTWGEGEPPDDAIAFFDYVKDLGEAALRELRFAVFALGDTSYENFWQCGRGLVGMLGACSAFVLVDQMRYDDD